MKMRLKILAMVALAILLAWLLWPAAGYRAPWAAKSAGLSAAASRAGVPVVSATTNASSLAAASNPSADSTNRVAFRLSNSTKSIGELTSTPHAILLENALIETDAKADLKIPAHLRAGSEPGAFIVQARGEIGAAFRAALAAAGGEIVSYIPNNAYLVRLSAAGAAGLTGNPLVQTVLPYAPYFKVQSSLLGLAVKQKPLPAETYLTLGLFGTGAAATESEIQKLGGEILARDRSPFGALVRVRPPANWIALAQLPGVQVLEPAHRRAAANDLSRQTIGVATNTVTTNSYLNLTGLNVTVEVNDTGIDASHPDLKNRIFASAISGTNDTVGHGTHVAGIIAGSGLESITVTNASGSILTNLPGPTASPLQFRGMAPAANLFSINFFGFNSVAQANDSYLQETPAKTNALISNNSWNYTGAGGYDLAAASYDAAVRDALPTVTAPQPVLFVFAAGNAGGGNDYGSGGNSDSVLSPATAKNVITVGALEQFRSITNTYLPLSSTNPTAAWALETDSGSQVAAFSSRGNVGVQTEGAYGRFKPDVVAPGTFVLSTRSTTWDTNAYFNPTNYHVYNNNSGQVVDTNYFNSYSLFVPTNAVGITLSLVPNTASASPFPNLTFYVSATDPNVSPTNYDFTLTTNTLSIPPQGGGGYLQTVVNNGVLYFAVAITNTSTTYDLVEEITTTNDLGNYYDVLHRINDQIGTGNPPWYRYESGTSMSAADVSGVLALMQDFFVNKKNVNFATNPSPALLKAMLINGARPEGSYGFAVTNTVNYQGWGVPQLPNSLPAALTNAAAGTNTPFFFLDQSPTNALQTGDRQTFLVSLSSSARALPLRITLAWTDPPGNPVAALKLVNNLDLVVTNLANGKVYYGNNFSSSGNYTASSATNSAAQFDSVNNVENVFIAPTLGTNYSVTIIGRSVNVNAVTTVQTNIAQDYALVISCGDGNNTNGFSVTPVTPAAVPATTPQVTYVGATNGVSILFNQLAGANAPLANTNTLAFGTNSAFATNAVMYVGQTNQWHFYIVTNLVGYTNAAFITFVPDTQSIPREGVFAGTTANSTRPEADLDLYVAGPHDAAAAGLTNLNPAVLANCLLGTNGDATALNRGGTEFVAYNNAALGDVYYVAVKCEDQMAAQYAFLSVFSLTPFSTLDNNGNQYVNGVNVPAVIPDGDNAHPGVGYVFGLALYPMQTRNVIVTNTIFHQNYGDLFGALSHSSAYSVLNNHDGLGSGTFTRVYDDSGQGDVPGSVTTDSPGSLRDFNGADATGLWLLTEVDNSLTQTGSVTGFTMKIEPHLPTNTLRTVTVAAKSWFYDYVTVPVGYTNLLVLATNLPPTATPPLQLYLNYNNPPGFSNYLVRADLTNGTPPGNSISYGPPLTPGTYWVGIYNPDNVSHDVLYGAFLSFNASAISTLDFASTGAVPLLDDAVTTNTITVTNTDVIQGIKVGLRVDHPRISDLVFHLISPDGSRYLLMENRGADSTNGCGLTVITTNIFTATASGTAQPNTNYINTGSTSGTFPITYNFYTAPDQMTVYYGTNVSSAYLIYDTGKTNNPPNNPPQSGGGPQDTSNETFTVTYGPMNGVTSTYLTIVMDAFLPTNRQDFWTYTAGGVFTNYEYLTFTEDTNLATTPIKFAPVPLVPLPQFYVATNFDGTNYVAVTNTVITNLYYQAEQSLSPLLGTHAAGNWQLEVLDNRTGATNNTSLVSWQLEFTFANTNFTLPTITITNGGGPVTNFVPGGATQWYSITVPTNADFATNALLFATLPLNVWFGSTSNSFDYELLTNSTSGTNVLSTNAPTPFMVPGGTYYLGFQNTNVGGATYAFEVNFHLALPVFTNGVPTTNSVPSNSVAYFQVNVPTNADFATNTLLFANLPLNVWLGTNSPPTTNVFLFSGTNGAVTLNTTSPPVLVPGATYYLGFQNTNSTNVTFAFEVNFHLALPVFTNGVPTTNSVSSNSVAYFQVNVPTNADFATNTLLFANLPLNVWFDTNSPPTTNVFLFGGLSGAATLNTTSPPVLVPGGTYYLGFQNTNSTNVSFAFEVNFHLLTNTPAPIVFVSIVATNYPTNGYLISWLAPTNDQFHLQWTASLIPSAWSNFNGVISVLRTNSATNGLFQYFDDGSQTGGFGPTRFYRLLLLNSPTNTAPYFFTNPPDVFLNPLATLTVTNAAGDWDIPAQTLTYSIANSLTGTNLATINPASGVISWTPAMSQNGLTNVITTVVTDNGVPTKSTTNSFTVIVNVIPPFSSVIVNTNGVNFQWRAFTNEQFQIQWTTNLVPPSWTPFPDIITSTNGIFTFVDTNTTLLMKFYRLWLLP